MKELKIKEIIGNDLKVEDAVILKREINRLLPNKMVLDFEDIKNIPSGFFSTLLTDLICVNTREYISSAIDVKNLSTKKDFKRVLLGTSIYQ